MRPFGVTLVFLTLITASTLEPSKCEAHFKAEMEKEKFADWFCAEEWWRW